MNIDLVQKMLKYNICQREWICNNKCLIIKIELSFKPHSYIIPFLYNINKRMFKNFINNF